MHTSGKKTTPPHCIGLITDFGLSDPYVGQLKGMLAQEAPHCRVVDISHDVSPFNVIQAGFFLASSYKYFPENTVFLAVVDPGVGTDRRIICLQIDGQLFLAPDNGLLGLVLKGTRSDNIQAFDLSAAINLPRKFSHTFHGRDVFAPLAARLVQEDSPNRLGTEIAPADIAVQDWSQPIITPGRATTSVLHIDRFGNCVLSLENGSLGDIGQMLLTGLSKEYLPCVETYGDLEKGTLGLLEGSQGYLEIAVNQHSAANKLGLSMGNEIELKWEV